MKSRTRCLAAQTAPIQSKKVLSSSIVAHADSGGFESPPLRKHKRCGVKTFLMAIL
ncbi:MAG: hypothetical protein ACOVMQ_01745 [Cyclobacteriaceae bacterium]